MKRYPLSALLALAAVAMTTSIAEAQNVEPVIAMEAGLSLVSPTAALGLEAGIRVDDEWTFLLEVDWNPFFSIEAEDAFETGVLNIGAGLEYIFSDGELRMAWFAGASTLLYDTLIDQGGSTGFFVEYVPLSIRIPLDSRVTMRIDPVSMHLVVPVLSAMPMVVYQFRHMLSFEVMP